MAKPVSPVISGEDNPETIYGANQPEYQPLPVYRYADGTCISRWKLTWRERIRCLIYGDVYLWQLTFNHPLQPILLEVTPPALPSNTVMTLLASNSLED